MMPIVQRLAALRAGIARDPPFVLARAFMGMFFSYYITDAARTLAASGAAHAMDHFVDIFLHGIL